MLKDYKTRSESGAILTNLLKCKELRYHWKKTSKYNVAEMISNTKREYKVKASTPIKDKQAQVHLLKIKKPRIFVPNAFTDESPDLQIYTYVYKSYLEEIYM